MIKFLQLSNSFRFKAEKDSKSVTITAEQCLGFVYGIDSFAVIQNFDPPSLGGGPVYNKYFAEVLEHIDHQTFFKRKFSEEIIYIIKEDSSKTYMIEGSINFVKNMQSCGVQYCS